MREPIENEYFNWLCAKVLDVNSRNYYDLLAILNKTEFIWVVPEDKHRAEEGVELRRDFLRVRFMERDSMWEQLPCSVLELLLAFALRAAFQTDDPVRDWFWEILANLKLENYKRVSDSNLPEIEDILYSFMWRTYDPSGFGGMFPLSQTQNDQTRVEIWYQFCEYMEDQGRL